jgi:YD repeat-containing protein
MNMIKRIAVIFALIVSINSLEAAKFDGAGLKVTDSTKGLSWKPTPGALSVSCWFKMSVPTGFTISENMTILVDRIDAAGQNDTYSYLIQYNKDTGNIEFSAKGPAVEPLTPIILIESPYLDRWYHVAVVRSGDTFYAYVDGAKQAQIPSNIGDSGNINGVSIGGWANSKYFYGEIQEVAIFQQYLTETNIEAFRFSDLEGYQENFSLPGYYKLSKIAREERFKNYSKNPPSGTAVATKFGPGTILFEDTEKSVEQSAFDAQKNGGKNATIPLSGSFSWEDTPIERPNPAIPFEFTLTYSSSLAMKGQDADELVPNVLTKGWRHSYEMRMIPTQVSSDRSIIMPDGAIETWMEISGGNYQTRHKEYRGKLIKFSVVRVERISGEDINYQYTDYILETPEHLKYYFYDPTSIADPMYSEKKGRLYKIEDKNNNKIELSYNFVLGNITKIIDTAGGVYDLTTEQNKLKEIKFGEWRVNFEYDLNSPYLLSAYSKTGPAKYMGVNTRRRFEYNAKGLLYRIYDPNSTTPTHEIIYDDYGRVIKVIDALGNITKTEYDKPAPRKIKRIDAMNNEWIETYDRKHRLIENRDPLNQIHRYAYDDFGNRITEIDARGYKTTHTYDPRSNRKSTEDPLGNVSQWNYHTDFNKVTQYIDPGGWITTYDYDDSNGNLRRQYDPNGLIAVYTYCPNGTYHINGLVQSVKDANTNETTFSYTPDGFLQKVTSVADGGFTQFAYNTLGWKETQIDPDGNNTKFEYDINGNVTKTTYVATDVAWNREIITLYDEDSKLIKKIDAKGNGYETRYVYNSAEQLIEQIDAEGGHTYFYYLPTGKTDKVKDALSNWTYYILLLNGIVHIGFIKNGPGVR